MRVMLNISVMEAEQNSTAAQSPPGSATQGLVKHVLFSRKFVPTYNLLLLALLLLYAVQKNLVGNDRRVIVREGLRRVKKINENAFKKNRQNNKVVDEERQLHSSPLIPNNEDLGAESKETTSLLRHGHHRHKMPSLRRRIRAFLMYQPDRVPILNRPLPSNGTSILILLMIALNVFYLLFRVPLGSRYVFVFADRAGLLFVVNLPFLYILSAKNQPFKALLGYSHETLNIFHRKLGEILICLAFFHFVGMVYVWYSVLRPLDFSFVRFITTRIILLGLSAYGAYNLIFLTSLRTFRQRCYEVFLFLHVFVQVAALVLLWLHHRSGRPYIAAALVIFLVDRIVLRTLRSESIPASLILTEDASTVLLSANWSIMHCRKKKLNNFISKVTPNGIRKGWQPGDHIFLTVPSLSRTSWFQAHPFTIASAAPPQNSTDPDAAASHAWFSVLVRSRKGFSALLRDAALDPTQSIREIDIRLDGPYGSGSALRMLKRSDVALVIAGGSGITVAFPLVWALLFDHTQGPPNESNRARETTDENQNTTLNPGKGPRSVALLWVTQSVTQRTWIPDENFRQLEAKGLQLYMSPPTEEAGRPDVSGFIRRYIADATLPVPADTRPRGTYASGSNCSSSSSTVTITPTTQPTQHDTKSTRITAKSAYINDEKDSKNAVIVSGPQSMNRDVRNTCASLVGREGWNIDVAVEQFEW